MSVAGEFAHSAPFCAHGGAILNFGGGGLPVNASDVLATFEPELADARAKATSVASALSPMLEEAKTWFANADRDTRILTSLAAGLVLGKVVSRLGR
jgi:hypothetical protein